MGLAVGRGGTEAPGVILEVDGAVLAHLLEEEFAFAQELATVLVEDGVEAHVGGGPGRLVRITLGDFVQQFGRLSLVVGLEIGLGREQINLGETDDFHVDRRGGGLAVTGQARAAAVLVAAYRPVAPRLFAVHMVVVHHAPADVVVVHDLVPVFAGAEAAVRRGVAVVLAAEEDAVGAAAQVAFTRVDAQFEDGLGTVLLRPGSHPVAGFVEAVHAAVDDIGEARGRRSIVVHIHIHLAQDGLVRVVVDVAEDFLLGQQRSRRVEVGDDLRIGLFHRAALELP